MTLAYYMDENVPGAITQGLRARGLDVVTVQEDGYMSTPDPAILDRAMALGRVTVTRDPDFLREAQRRQQTGEPFAGVAYLRPQWVSHRRCIDDLEIVAYVETPATMTNHVVYIPL